MEANEPPSDSDVAARISTEIAAVHEECYGEPVRNIRTYLLDDLVMCVLDIQLLTHERTILDTARGHESVREVRKQFQETISSTFLATVEHMTGRRVIGFLSNTHLDPPFSIEVFRLAPQRTGALDEVP